MKLRLRLARNGELMLMINGVNDINDILGVFLTSLKELFFQFIAGTLLDFL